MESDSAIMLPSKSLDQRVHICVTYIDFPNFKEVLQIICIDVAVRVVIYRFESLMHIDLSLVLTAHPFYKHFIPQVCRPHISICSEGAWGHFLLLRNFLG